MAGEMGSAYFKIGRWLPSFYLWHHEMLPTQRMFSGFTFDVVDVSTMLVVEEMYPFIP